MKVSIIGAGNVGGTLAQRIAEAELADVVLLDIADGVAKGKVLDLSDARSIINYDCKIQGTGDYKHIQGSSIVVITAGLPRTPGMTREDLLKKNAVIIKSVTSRIVENAPQAIILVVTNPLDILTNLVLKISNCSPHKVIGMGGVLDSSRFANIIAEELNVPVSTVEALVIGAHGPTMIPLPRFSKVKGRPLTELLPKKKYDALLLATIERGAKIVAHLGKGSAYYAPSAAAFSMVKSIIQDAKKIVPACAYCNGEYGITGVCIGVPIKLGAAGIEEIVNLDLTTDEQEKLIASANAVKEAVANLI